MSPLCILVWGHFDGTADKGKEAELILCTKLESEPLGVMAIQNRLGQVWLEKIHLIKTPHFIAEKIEVQNGESTSQVPMQKLSGNLAPS